MMKKSLVILAVTMVVALFVLEAYAAFAPIWR